MPEAAARRVLDTGRDDDVARHEPARVGRPRDPRVDAAIRTATLELLAETGYQATTIQAIARRAGVSAPSVYRRWSSKGELVEEALFPSVLLAPEASDGDVVTDLVPYCRQILRYLCQPAIRAALPGLLVEYQHDHRLWVASLERRVGPMRASFGDYLVATGLVPIAEPALLFDVMLGALYTRAINVGDEDLEQFARTVALVITASLTPPTDGPREADRR